MTMYVLVRERCYSLNQVTVGVLSRFLLDLEHLRHDTHNAMKSGLWTGTSFVSPLLVQEVFRELVKTTPPSKTIKLDFSGKSSPLVQQIIVAGLANMRAQDFEEDNYSYMYNNERGLAFRWGVCAGAALKEEVWLTSEVVTKDGAIDFVVNGRPNLGLELARDRTPEKMLEKLKKIGKGGSSRDSYLFHFVFNGTLDEAVQQVKKFPQDQQLRVYTFTKDCNSLLCGTKIVHSSGVVRSLLPTPTPSTMHPIGTRHFSTLAFGALRHLRRLV